MHKLNGTTVVRAKCESNLPTCTRPKNPTDTDLGDVRTRFIHLNYFVRVAKQSLLELILHVDIITTLVAFIEKLASALA